MEILAPAGSMRQLKAAIASGANAVYLGLDLFNARAKADNFNKENFKSVLEYAHLFHVKIYVTFNILLKEDELKEALALVSFVDSCGADAIIVQDFALLEQISNTMPHITLHASTQMGIHNLYGALSAEKLGVDRIILSRECTLKDILEIKQHTNLEIECFVQGALCVAFSGNCYFSSLVSGYSGNRGKCMQLCRKKYLINGQQGYFLSPADLCLAKHIEQLKNVGVCSLKIEGRMRSPEYVHESVKIYKKALSQSITVQDIDALKNVFNRGNYTEGHLFQSTNHVIYPHAQNNIGYCIGHVQSVINKRANIKLNAAASVGDGIKYMRLNKEVGNGLLSNLKETTFQGDVQKGDLVHRTLDMALIKQVSNLKTKIQIKISGKFVKNEIPQLDFNCDDISVQVYGDVAVSDAINAPTTLERIKETLTKMGDTHFECNDFSLRVEDNIFYPIGKLNELRRKGCELLQEKRLDSYKKSPKMNLLKTSLNDYNWLKPRGKYLKFVQIDKNFNGMSDISHCVDYVIFNPQNYSLQTCKEFFKHYGEKAVLNLPLVARDQDLIILKDIVENSGIQIFLVNNLYGLQLCKSKTLIGGSGLNLLNNYFDFLSIQSLESDNMPKSSNKILYAFGHVPLMTLCHCPNKTLGQNCNQCNGYSLELTDEKNARFPCRRVKISSCYSQLLNGVPMSFLEEYQKGKLPCSVLFDLTFADQQEQAYIRTLLLNNEYTEFYHTHGNMRKKLY